MTTLNQPHIGRLLDRLHAEADLTDATLLREMRDDLSSSNRTIEDAAAHLIAAERGDYRRVYRGYADCFLAVSRDYGRFLYALARATRAKRIVEFGSSMGVSAIYLAAALRDNGGGHLIGAELEPGKAARARTHLTEAGLLDLVEIREGDALDTLRDAGGPIDLALLDGAWSLYLPILKLIEPHLRDGAVILGENAFARDYLDYVRDPANGYLAQALPIDSGRGNEFAVKIG